MKIKIEDIVAGASYTKTLTVAVKGADLECTASDIYFDLDSTKAETLPQSVL